MMFARQYSQVTARQSLIRKYGIPGIYTYGAISLIELPIFFGIVHYTGTDWMEDLEMRLRSAVGASTAKEDTWVHKASENKGGQLLTELASVFLLHKVFIVARLPLSIALAPAASRLISKPRSSISQDPMQRFGTPANKRNKWLAWFF